jgi:hypothetical protein
MAHTVVRIIELVIANAFAAAVTAMFLIVVYSVVHGLRTVGRQR